ncbi:hypothetical protein KEM52_005419 [Ascosphaera acerosa]|nr:hypothetical protein KEM52_005419 [Ascosphaera acerosa]
MAMAAPADGHLGAAPVPLIWNEAASGIFGSISMTCWFFLMVPQLLENYQNQSAEAISISFLAIWLLGDAANLLGSVWARLVPVIIAIAFYFAFADSVLLAQCMYYNVKSAAARKFQRATGVAAAVHAVPEERAPEPDATTPLLSGRHAGLGEQLAAVPPAPAARSLAHQQHLIGNT